MMIALALLTAALSSTAAKVQPEPACLHAAGRETAEQRDRSVAALAATRAVNTAQAAFARQAKEGGGRKYATREELQGSIADPARYNLSPNAEIVPGFKLMLDTTANGYWFEIVDTKDACGFRYVSNQSGLILAAQPIR
jgi:hypothetical protein